MGNRWCVRIICITLGILLKYTSKVEGSNGCPESQSLDLGNSFQNVSWDTTWSDYQSKTCSWRLNFQTPDIVEFTLRLEKLILSSHDAFVYSDVGIVQKRMKDKIQMEVCGDGDKTELSSSPAGQEFHRRGSAVCFFIPHADYNFGQNIFTTHFIKMEISVKRNLVGTEKLGSTTRSFEETPISNNNPGTTFIRGTDFLKNRLTTVKAITTTMTSSSDSHPGIEYTSLPVRLTSDSPYLNKTSNPSSSHPFTDRELFSSKLSTHFSRTSGTIFNPLSTVSMATPWTLTVRTTETTLVFGTTRSNDPAVNTFASDPTDEKSNVYLIAGVVSGTAMILLLMIFVVIFILRTRRRNEEDTSAYRLSYSQPWPWRKNWVITRSFNEIEAERAKAEMQLKPVLPFRPSLKRFPVAPSQDTVSESLDVEENGVYDNIVA
ncbi:uncharacterized protein LOC111131201 [Crassostrea virginica]